VPRAQFNALIARGVAEFELVASAAVDPALCQTTYVQISMTYWLIAPDDCNANGQPDLCDIITGYSLDLDGNGIPDECPPIGSDIDGDGDVDADDFLILASCLVGPDVLIPPICDTSDQDGDGDVDLADYALLARAQR
jgi:hypothetical protein